MKVRALLQFLLQQLNLCTQAWHQGCCTSPRPECRSSGDANHPTSYPVCCRVAAEGLGPGQEPQEDTSVHGDAQRICECVCESRECVRVFFQLW